jgi:hypothetical protein
VVVLFFGHKRPVLPSIVTRQGKAATRVSSL